MPQLKKTKSFFILNYYPHIYLTVPSIFPFSNLYCISKIESQFDVSYQLLTKLMAFGYRILYGLLFFEVLWQIEKKE